MRPRKAPGELGRVTPKQRPSGRWRARTSIRAGDGSLVPLSVEADTHDEALAKLEEEARRVWGGLPVQATVTTLGQLAALWDAHLDIRVKRREITPQTADTYREAWRGARTATDRRRTPLAERWGAIPLSSFTTVWVRQAIELLEVHDGPAYATRAHRTLSLIGRHGQRTGILDHNPVQGAGGVRATEPVFQTVDADQVRVMLHHMEAWRAEQRGGVKPNTRLLVDVTVLLLATGLRPGEVLALRREDVQAVDGVYAVRVAGTITLQPDEATGRKVVRRQAHPKARRQQRWLTLPEWAEDTIRRRLAAYVDNPDSLLFATRNGTPYAVRYYQKLLRSWRNDHAKLVGGLGLDPQLLVARSFRKTVGTTLAREAGVERAREQLGHADDRTTRRFYIEHAEHVSSETADVLAEAFRGVLGG